MARATSQTTTDHEAIRRWVEERGGWPAEVESTARGEGDIGIIRIDFPGFSGEGQLRRIDWDEWFDKFDGSGLAFVHQDTTAGGERSNFNKLVARETAAATKRGKRTARRAGGAARARRPSDAGRARSRATGARAGKKVAAGKPGRATSAGKRSTAGGAAARKAGGRATRKRTASRAAGRTTGSRAGGGRRAAGGRGGTAGRKVGRKTTRRSRR
jgi:hypothetical protein